MLMPKLFTTFKTYSRQQFISDSIAGVVVGVVAIPLAIAFAMASGVSPDRGLVTVVIAGFFVSVLGGSRVQIGGPTGAFVVVVYGIVQKHGLDGLIVATLMAGILLVVMGLAKFGAIIKFIPYSVVVGFTSGIAVIIFKSQVKDFFGLNFGALNPAAAVLGLLTVFIIAVWPRFSRRVPGALIALVLTSGLAILFHLPVETIGSRFGVLPHTLPPPHFPQLNLTMIKELFQPAFTLALLGAIESLLSAVVADGMIGGRHRSNMELIGQGVANMASALFGGMPATGAIARTVTNIKNGGRTPVAGIIHAITVLFIMLCFGPLITHVPLACLAGILVVVAYHMSEWRSFLELLKSSRGVVAVLLTTFLVTIFVDLTAAIQMGMILYAFIFMKRMSDATSVRLFTQAVAADERVEDRELMNYDVPRGVEIYEIDGPLFLSAADQFDEIDREVSEKPRVRILRFRDVPFIDSTGMHALKSFVHKCRNSRIHLIITGLHVQPLNEIVKANLYDIIGEDNVFSSMKEAIARAQVLVERSWS